MKQIFSPKRVIAAVSAAVLLAAAVLNIVVGTVFFRNRYITDLTSEGMYTVDPLYRELLDTTFREVSEKREEAGEAPVSVRIIFCDEPDVLIGDSSRRYIYYTALSLERMYPDFITVSCVDVGLNPSAVQAYKASSASEIYPTSVIVASGTEFRVFSVKSFYYFDSSDYSESSPIGYCGDKTFTQAIRSVTSAESPVCCLVTNHGERYGEAFISLLSKAGYRVVTDFDLRYDPIPDDCRLMISSGAKTDFYAVFGDTVPEGDDEIDKLSGFLDSVGAFLFFFDPDTPPLPVIEEYLAEWGTVIDRSEGVAFRVTDPENSISEDGSTLIGSYASSGLGASILSDMLSQTSPEKVVFPHCGSISAPKNYRVSFMDEDKDSGLPGYQYWFYSSGGVNRSSFNFFTAGENAVATAGDLVSNTGSNRLMSITMEYRVLMEDQGYTWVTQASYVVTGASTAFLSDEALGKNRFGNSDVMLSLLRTVGRETYATDNVYRMFRTSTIGTVHPFSQSDLVSLTVWLTITPAVILLAACVIVMVKRRNKA